ncbi:MAG: dihydrodipicolinate synthase family protein [Opitutales bacterium]
MHAPSPLPVVPLTTPFQRDGTVDHAALADSCRWMEAAGIRHLLPGGSTGEFPALTVRERIAVLETVRGAFSGAVQAHVSACDLESVQTLRSAARDLADTDLLLPPFYFNGLQPAGLIGWYQTAFDDPSRPAWLYHFPRFTGITVSVDLLARIAEACPALAGVKDSSADLANATAFKERCPGLQIVLGNDSDLMAVAASPIDGSVTLPNYPHTYAGFHAALAAGDTMEATRLARLIAKLAIPPSGASRGVFQAVTAKALLSAQLPGYPARCRLPFVELASDERAALVEEFTKVLAEEGLALAEA